jgi:hypothetical protein
VDSSIYRSRETVNNTSVNEDEQQYEGAHEPAPYRWGELNEKKSEI